MYTFITVYLRSIHFSWAYNPLAALGILKRENCHDFEVNLGYGGVRGGCLLRKKINKILETNAFHHVIFYLNWENKKHIL